MGPMNVVPHREVVVAVLGSGSRGNATYIGNGETGVLVDCGLSALQIRERMAAVDLGDAPICAVLITHDHRDHVVGGPVLARKLAARRGRPVPFLMTPGTLGGLQYRKLVPDGVVQVRAGQRVDLGVIDVQPFSIPHDTADPVAWRVDLGGVQVGVITDLGRPTHLVQENFRKLDVAVFEFNHDMEMLLAGPYPWELKQRIRSNQGHLSNEQSAQFLEENLVGPLSHLVLGHLSEENNRPVHALTSAARALKTSGREGLVRIHVAEQDRPIPPIRVALA